MHSGRAHSEALLLAHSIRQVDGIDGGHAVQEVQSLLLRRGLISDLHPVLAFGDGEKKVQLEASTPFGHAVLEELVDGAEFPPCPDGMCEFSVNTCRWCGSIRA